MRDAAGNYFVVERDSPARVTSVMERDAHGNFIRVERDYDSGELTVKGARTMAKARARRPPGVPMPGAGPLRGGLLGLLRSLGLERWAPHFEREALLDATLLRSFGPTLLEAHMRELGLDADERSRLTNAFFNIYYGFKAHEISRDAVCVSDDDFPTIFR